VHTQLRRALITAALAIGALVTGAVAAHADAGGAREGVATAAFTRFVPVPPQRLLDTRPGPGQVGYQGPMPGAGAVVEVQVTGRGGVPDDAIAVALNLTGTAPLADGYVTAWPCGAPPPLASNLNLVRGRTSPNAALVTVGERGRVCLLTERGAHLLVDVAGYLPAGARYQATVPHRVLDTRTGVGALAAKPGPHGELRLQLGGTVPDSADAVVLNLTGTDATADGYVTAWPCGQPRPEASNLNLVRGGTTPNLVVVKLGDAADVCLYTQSGAHLVADVNGWFLTESGYTPLQPVRVLDTRLGLGAPASKPGPGAVVELDLRSWLPDDADAVALNLTGTEASAPGFVTAWPCGPMPTTSNLNLVAGATAPNVVIGPVSANQRLCLFTQSGTHLVADLNGWFSPGT